MTYTATQRLAAEELLRRRAVASLTVFKRMMYKRYEHGRHLEVLDRALEQVTRYVETGGAEGIGRLIVEMPPRHGKTITTSRLYPTWHLGRNPDHRVMLVSYGATLAHKNSRMARNLMRSPRYKATFGLELAEDSKAADAWDVADHEGGCDAMGITGGATGKGAHCFPAGTMVLTENGEIDIAELCSMSNPPRVLSYDHGKGCTVWASIEATNVVQSEQIIEVTTRDGRRLLATSDHPVFVAETGYIPAERLRSGHELFTTQHDMPPVRRGEEQAQQAMPILLREEPRQVGNVNLRILRQGIQSPTLSTREGGRAELYGHLLFKEVFKCPSCGKERQDVRFLREAATGQKKQQVLFEGVPKRSPATEVAARVPAVRRAIHGQKYAPTILLKGVCKPRTFSTNGGGRQFSFQGWDELRGVVYRDASPNSWQRQQSVCGVWRKRTPALVRLEGAACSEEQFGYPSHKREPARQYARELDYPVQDVSCDTPQVERDAVAVVRRIRTGAQPVYDLQVEGCHNFFANSVLVHNCLIIDDPIKNRAEAESDTYRDNIWDAYINDLYTRLEPGGAIVVIHTRWHQDDLIGRLTAREPDEWHRIRMPAIAEADDPLGRKEGEALWPWRFPLEVLKRIAKAVGDYVWAALYQQRPTPAEGGIIKRKSLLDHLVPSIPTEQLQHAVRFWDLAMSSKTSADYTASVKYGLGFDGRRKLMDARKEQLDWADVTEYLAQTALEDGPDVIIGIEEQGYMSRAVQDLVQDSRLQSYAIFGYPAHKDKLTRGLPFAAKVGAGVVDILEAHWTWNLIDELCAFPNGTHDDWWDAAAGAETMLDQGGIVLGGMVDATAAGALVGAY